MKIKMDRIDDEWWQAEVPPKSVLLGFSRGETEVVSTENGATYKIRHPFAERERHLLDALANTGIYSD